MRSLLNRAREYARLTSAIVLVCLAPALQGNLGRAANFNERILAAHNRERDALGIAPLNWDQRLAAEASQWANELTDIGYLVHSDDDAYDSDADGENLWAGTAGYYSPESMVGLWVAEKRVFRPGIFPANSRTGDMSDVGHYTQVVWRNTTRVGCAIARGDEDEFLVCRYSEGGNVIGERPF